MLTIFVVVFLVAITIILILAVRKPDRFSVTRSVLIKATAPDLFPYFNDLKVFRTWSPWEGRDPLMKARLSSNSVGPGATYEWSGDKKVGQGRMQIHSTETNKQVVIRLIFIKPFEAQNTVEFLLTPELKNTRVVWKIHGPNNLMSKIMQVFVSMDKMIGSDFELGLENLQDLIEEAKNTSSK